MFKIIFIVTLFVIPFANSFSKDKPIQDLVWMSEEYPPYNFIDVNGKKQGIAIELLEATLAHLKIDQTRKDFKIWPWARGYRMAQNSEKLNAIFSTTRTKEREPLFEWVGPIAKTRIQLFSLSSKKVTITSNKQLSNYSFAVIRDDIGELTLKTLGVKKENISSLPRVEHMIKMLLKGRVDFIAYESNVLNFLAKKLGHEGKFKPVYTIKSGELWYALNTSVSDDSVVKYQRALNAAKKKPSVKKVLKSKFGVTLP